MRFYRGPVSHAATHEGARTVVFWYDGGIARDFLDSKVSQLRHAPSDPATAAAGFSSHFLESDVYRNRDVGFEFLVDRSARRPRRPLL